MQTQNTVSAPTPTLAQRAVLPLILIISLFFLWGMANNLNDILITQFKKAFELSDFQAGLVQSAFYLGYFILAIPAGIFMRKFGYKNAVIFGLILYAAGAFLFYPAAQFHTYSLFLMALFVIASGLAFLETSANPFITVLGSPETAAGRLNLAQAFNPLGSITGIIVGQQFIFSGVEYSPEQLAAMTTEQQQAYYTSASLAVQTPYLVIGIIVLIWTVLVAFTRFPIVANYNEQVVDKSEKSSQIGGFQSLLFLFKQRRVVFAILAQFFYVGAQVGIWSYLIRYAQDVIPGMQEVAAANFLTISLVLFMAGRFIGAACMRYLSAYHLLMIVSTINIFLMAVGVFLPGKIGLYALVASSLFMSVMFPTIFALGLNGLDNEQRKLGSSLIVMAIIGGAILTIIMGAISDAMGIHYSMLVPLVSFAVILWFGFYSLKNK